MNVGTPLALESVEWRREGGGSDKTVADMTVVVKGDRRQVSGKGNGSLDAASHALRLALGGIVEFHFADYVQHAIETDSDARAAAILNGRHVHPDMHCIIIPATQKIYLDCIELGYTRIFVEAGCVVSTPTYGPCLGGHMGIPTAGER